MTGPRVHQTQHQTTIAAPAVAVFARLADVTGWPLTFGPTIHAEQLERVGDEERIQIWATTNEAVRTWTSHRVLDQAAGRITFRQETPTAPVAAMSGEWIVTTTGPAETLVVLRHGFAAVDDLPGNVDWVRQAVDVNSDAELAALRANLELERAHDGLTFTIADTIQIAAPARLVYDFLHDVASWPRRLPHVARLDLYEGDPNVQRMTMDSRTTEGTVHTTESVRICFPPLRIVYKQLVPPALLLGHTGEWTVHSSSAGAVAVARHAVTLNPAAIGRLLGPEATVDAAREHIRTALSRNSSQTLQHAKTFAEQHATSAGNPGARATE